jgi:hypothetical protein
MAAMPFAAYPYMGLSLLLLLIAAAAWLAWPGSPGRRDARWLMLVAGLACGPYGLFSFMYIPKYWMPVLTSWFGPASPEDILFAIATGALGMAFALWPFRQSIRVEFPGWRTFFLRYFAFAATGIGLGYAILIGSGWRVETMLGFLISVSAAALVVFINRPDLRVLILPGIAFPVFYWLMLRLSFVLWPEFSQSWAGAEQQHLWIGRVPAYEVFWACGLGCVWPAMIGWCTGLRLDRPAAA